MRVKLTIAYDGAPFAGWQSQAGGGTVQDFIEAALAKIAGQKISLHGAGRTDAGVHALGMIAHFDAPATTRLAPSAWRSALNATLPPAVRILQATRAPKDFHARFDARGKIYRYEICTAHVLPPHRHRRAWHIPQGLDVAVLRDTLQIFVGAHDFRAFAANRRTPVTDPVRTISSIRATQSGHSISLTFQGNGFLYKMVRMLTGAGVRVAQGKESPERLRALLAAPTSGHWTFVAPADGLYLVRVLY
jgi:tRNA pseudouridine38-40 synthase